MSTQVQTVQRVVVPKLPSFGAKCAAAALFSLGKCLGWSLRIRMRDDSGIIQAQERKPIIFALWHNRLALSMEVWCRYVRPHGLPGGLVALISASRDGAFLAQVLKHFRVRAVRGSSSRRGPQALRELNSLIKTGVDIAITPDGPRGPRHIVQEGVIALAQLGSIPIVPVGIHIRWKRTFKSWDAFQLPLPFSSCSLHFGQPIYVPEQAEPAEREVSRLELERSLLALNA